MPTAPPNTAAQPLLRLFDVLLAGAGLLLLWPLLALLAVAGWFDTGSPLLRQPRVGRGGRPFVLVKFRTMAPQTAHVASHLADAAAVTRWGRWLRRTKLDELPQLWNVLRGDMSLVGPRPCLPTQHELIGARQALGVLAARPGITGLAQVSGIDMSTPVLLAQTDARMLQSLTVRHYFGYLLRTVSGAGAGDAVKAAANQADAPARPPERGGRP
jgi:lipopolysaccharide/colanic/teichoic acid biosynthesis glycosyltransferase